jgi:tripartite-type tricarboxylate transporter receptor subunit TctC
MDLNLLLRSVVAAAAVLQAGAAPAQSYPARPVTLYVGLSAGGSVDLLARAAADELSAALGQRFVVVNREGGSMTIAMRAVLSAAADGYTLGAGPATPFTHVLHVLNEKPFAIDQFEFVCQYFRNDFTVSVRQESPFHTLRELFDAMRAKPGGLSYGHTGKASVTHVAAVDLLQRAGLSAIDVPFSGEAASLPMLLGGTLDFAPITVATAVAQKQRLRVLAVFSEKRHPNLPDAPTLAEQGIRMPSHAAPNGIFAPRGSPRAVVQTLESACEKAVRSERFAQLAAKYSAVPAYLNSAAFTQLVLEDNHSKGELIRGLALQ